VQPWGLSVEGRRAVRRQLWRASGPPSRAIDISLRYLGALGQALVPWRSERLLTWQERQLRLAGSPLGLEAGEVLVMSAVGATLGAAVGGLGPFPGGAFLGTAAVGAILPQARLQALEAERLKAAAREMPRTMDLLALCMSAGMDLAGALREVSGGDSGVIAEELRYLLSTLEMGVTRKRALEDFQIRLPAEEVREFVRAVIQAEAKGASVRDALVQQASMSRHRRSVRAEELAARAAVLLIGPMMMLVVAMLLLIIGPMVIGGIGL
jgi:tight adherence protein C